MSATGLGDVSNPGWATRVWLEFGGKAIQIPGSDVLAVHEKGAVA